MLSIYILMLFLLFNDNQTLWFRSGNSLDDVEDLDLNVEDKNDDTSHRDFSLGECSLSDYDNVDTVKW